MLPDPTGSGQTLVSTSTTAAAFTTIATVPSGLVAMFRTAAAIATGWTRESNLDGRMPVGAGTTFSVTYVEDTAYGAAWSHVHDLNSHSHLLGSHNHGGSASFSGTTGGPGGVGTYDEDDTGNGHTAYDDGHTHGFSGSASISIENGPTGNASGNTGTTSWVIPSRAYVFAKKD